MNDGTKQAFVLYFDIREPLELLTDAERGKLFMAIIDYAENGTEPEFSGSLQMAFAFIKQGLDRDTRRWNQKRERRIAAGRSGGMAKAANAAKEASGKATESEKTENVANVANVANVSIATNATHDVANVANVAVPVPVPVSVPVSVPVPVPAPVPVIPKGIKSSSSMMMIDIQSEWNRLGLVRVTKISEGTKRYRDLSERIETYGAEAVLSAIRRIVKSDYLMGRAEGSRKASFDWFLMEGNFQKVAEGFYDNIAPQEKTGAGPDAAATRAAFERLQKEENNG